MKKSRDELLEDRKAEVEFRTDRTQATFGPRQLSESPVVFEASEKTRATSHGGLALIHQVAVQSGLCDAINAAPVLKVRLPYHESDHVLNLAYNFLCGGTALDHIEYRRNDPAPLEMLGTHSIPDPTTAGDFCRRYSPEQIVALQEAINETRINVWSQQPKSFFDEADVDRDGAIASTCGECKQGMDVSYKGEWGYHPLIVSFAKTKEILYVKNRSGNRPSHEDAHVYVDKSIALLKTAGFKKIRFRGDTDFSQTQHLDRWDDANVLFVFGIDATPNLVGLAETLENTAWERLARPAKYEVKTEPRGGRENVKEKIVIERGYKNLVLEHEDVAEIDYRPVKCQKSYRLVICRKTISVKRGQQLLIPEIRYFFYLTNDREQSASEIVFESNDRCNQENLIGRLKSGMNALSTPLDNLNSNGMYLVTACLAWTLKSWTALSLAVDGRKREEKRRKDKLLKMEFATFLQAIIMIPVQVIRSGRQTIVRFLNVNDWTATFFQLVEQLKPAKRIGYTCRRE
ncbi:MAG: IS1380 family transposase [Planctomycetaceae bacterium]|nr:IS1380 family transposase [Planctomycetaceae bacterium]